MKRNSSGFQQIEISKILKFFGLRNEKEHLIKCMKIPAQMKLEFLLQINELAGKELLKEKRSARQKLRVA